jgi:hypothetical protein
MLQLQSKTLRFDRRRSVQGTSPRKQGEWLLLHIPRCLAWYYTLHGRFGQIRVSLVKQLQPLPKVADRNNNVLANETWPMCHMVSSELTRPRSIRTRRRGISMYAMTADVYATCTLCTAWFYRSPSAVLPLIL